MNRPMATVIVILIVAVGAIFIFDQDRVNSPINAAGISAGAQTETTTDDAAQPKQEEPLYAVHFPHLSCVEYLEMLKDLDIELLLTIDKSGKEFRRLPWYRIETTYTTSPEGTISEGKYIKWITGPDRTGLLIQASQLRIPITEGIDAYGPSIHAFQACDMWDGGNPHQRILHSYSNKAYGQLCELKEIRKKHDNEKFPSAFLSTRKLSKVHVNVATNEEGKWQFAIGALEYK